MSEYKVLGKSFTVNTKRREMTFHNLDDCRVADGALIMSLSGFQVAAFSTGSWDSFWEISPPVPLVSVQVIYDSVPDAISRKVAPVIAKYEGIIEAEKA